MKRYLFILLLVPFCAFAQSKHNITKGAITFQIKNLGFNSSGNFGTPKGDILFNPAHLEASSMDVFVETTTIDTDNDSRDEHLKSSDFFDAVKYPKITIKSISFKHKSGSNYIGVFKLTIKSKTNTLEIPFTYNEVGNMAVFKGTLKIKRSDYGIGGTSLTLSDDVTISISAETEK